MITVMCAYCRVLRKNCGRLFELFARIEHLADMEPVISLLYPATANDQVCNSCLFDVSALYGRSYLAWSLSLNVIGQQI